MISLIVDPRTVALEQECGWTGEVQLLLTVIEDKLVGFNLQEKFPTHSEIEILFVNEEQQVTDAILTEQLEKALLIYLRDYHAKENMEFDCCAFAELVAGVKRESKLSLEEYWNLSVKDRDPNSGEVIFLLSDDGYFMHAAIYIGEDMYISVYGAGGDLNVSTLKQMEKDFASDQVVFVTKR